MSAAAFANGRVFAVERGPDQPYASLVHVLSPTGKALFEFGKGVIETAHGAHIGDTPEGSRLFITDMGDFTVKVFDFESGTLLRTFGEPHKEGTSLDPIQFGNVADVATDPRNASRFFVVDGDGGPNNRLLALDWASGRVLWSRGGAPTAKPGGFDVPHSVAWDAGRQAVWVADRSNNRTQVLSARDGSFLFEWSCFLPGSQPWSVRIDSVRGTVLVADGTAGYLYVMPLPSADDPNPACRVSQALPLPPAAAKLHEMAVDETTGAIYIAQVGDPTALLKLRVMPTGRD
ncbi:hypothetical protein FNF31_06711 [Cafeteria roenbergensis]|nr:hypothetical protein FNF31_06711 [Cafeteria roenbergensis]